MEFLLWAIGIYLFVVVVLPRWFRWMIRRRLQRFQQPHGRPQKEGKVTLKTDSAAASKRVSGDVGEYVEFEEC